MEDEFEEAKKKAGVALWAEYCAKKMRVEELEEKNQELLDKLKEREWRNFDYKNEKKMKKLKGKYLCETMSGNIWVADLNKDKSSYPHKCSCGMNAAMSMHFTKYKPLPTPPRDK